MKYITPTSDTPETDAKAFSADETWPHSEVVYADFARDLERRLAVETALKNAAILSVGKTQEEMIAHKAEHFRSLAERLGAEKAVSARDTLAAQVAVLTKELDEARFDIEMLINSENVSITALLNERDTLLAKVAELEKDKERMDDVIETAWGIIANAGEGDWTREHADWKKAAERWRDENVNAMYEAKHATIADAKEAGR